jgi:hypothetical protein
MHRRTLLQFIGGTTLSAGLGGAQPTFAADSTLKIGTVFPKSSPWGKVLETWVKAVNQKSGGRMTLQVFYNGIQGDEDALVAKIKSGQLSGALVTGVGLGKVYKPILALQMPGLFSSWAKLDKARDAMKAEFEKGASDAGFSLAGWGDVGLVRLLSKGFVLKQPDDLKGKKPFYLRADAINPAPLLDHRRRQRRAPQHPGGAPAAQHRGHQRRPRPLPLLRAVPVVLEGGPHLRPAHRPPPLRHRLLLEAARHPPGGSQKYPPRHRQDPGLRLDHQDPQRG